MNMLIAKNPKQLVIGLRLLYAEKVKFQVQVDENEYGKIYYSIHIDRTLSEDATKLLMEKYRILIS